MLDSRSAVIHAGFKSFLANCVCDFADIPMGFKAFGKGSMTELLLYMWVLSSFKKHLVYACACVLLLLYMLVLRDFL